MKSARKKKQKKLAFIGDECTGCGGTPVCMAWCPIDGALEHLEVEGIPAGRVVVNTDKCTGCSGCLTRGPLGSYVQGCPWNAITLVPVQEAQDTEQASEKTQVQEAETSAANI